MLYIHANYNSRLMPKLCTSMYKYAYICTFAIEIKHINHMSLWNYTAQWVYCLKAAFNT